MGDLSTRNYFRQKRADCIKVTIEEVNSGHRLKPMALGRDYYGAQIQVDLERATGPLFALPKVGEQWWVERRTVGDWTLVGRQAPKARGLKQGDAISEGDDLFINYNGIKVKDNADTAYDTGFTGTVTVIVDVDFIGQTFDTNVLRYKNGLLVEVQT